MQISKASAIVSIAGALICGITARAAAQEPLGDISAGYQFVRVTGDQYADGLSLPAGWTASLSHRVTPLLTLVGEVNGSYSDGSTLHNFLGGVRFGSLLTNRVNGFGQVLAGLAHGSSGDYGVGENGLNIQPGVGVDFQALNRIGLRLQADYLIIKSSGITTNAFRLAAGVVFQITR